MECSGKHGGTEPDGVASDEPSDPATDVSETDAGRSEAHDGTQSKPLVDLAQAFKGDHPRVVLAQRAATVDQEPQQGELLVVDHRSQPRHPGVDQGDGVSVGGIGLAALPGREDPRTS